MPQAPTYLQNMFKHDGDALAQLQDNFIIERGGIIRPKANYIPTHLDIYAIDYLILEWDYGYEANQK